MRKPDLVMVIENEGSSLKQKGNRFWTQCPLHPERTPSFMADPDKQRWHCFGCNNGGDVIDFIQKYKGLSFKDALGYLGISPGRPSPEAIKKIEQEKYKRELIKAFRDWCNDYHSDLCTLFRTLQKAKGEAKTVLDVEALADFYHQESMWLHRIGILMSNDDEAKFKLYKEVAYGNCS